MHSSTAGRSSNGVSPRTSFTALIICTKERVDSATRSSQCCHLTPPALKPSGVPRGDTRGDVQQSRLGSRAPLHWLDVVHDDGVLPRREPADDPVVATDARSDMDTDSLRPVKLPV
jgi:hypothetical protein